jgi:hypothetical protein
MSNLPEARRQLGRIARRLRAYGDTVTAGRIMDVIDRYLHRRAPVRRMPIRSRPITRLVKEQIIELARNTDMHTADIAARVGVNPGRVSEVLHGDR